MKDIPRHARLNRALRAVPKLRQEGYSIRQIMRMTGYKSTNSIQKILKGDARIVGELACPDCGSQLLLVRGKLQLVRHVS